jgi:hypothetical protein
MYLWPYFSFMQHSKTKLILSSIHYDKKSIKISSKLVKCKIARAAVDHKKSSFIRVSRKLSSNSCLSALRLGMEVIVVNPHTFNLDYMLCMCKHWCMILTFIFLISMARSIFNLFNLTMSCDWHLPVKKYMCNTLQVQPICSLTECERQCNYRQHVCAYIDPR